MSDLKLGRGGKMGSVNPEQIKGGLKKEDIKDKNMQNIFDSVDVNKDGVLDADEIKKFQEQIQNAAGDDNLSSKEAKKYLKQNNMKNIDKKDLFKFINELSQASENIESSTVTENNGQKIIHVKYKDGTTETINPDKSTEIASQGENGQTITKYYDKDKKLLSQKTVDANGQTEVTKYGDDGKPSEVETTAKGGNPVQTTAYEDGKPVKTELRDGSTLEIYSYDEDGNPVMDKKIENEGIPAKEKVTKYTQNEDGTVTAHTKEYGKETTQTIKDGQVVSETINENGKKTERTHTENGFEEVTDDGATKTTFNNENKKLSQTKTVNGQTYNVEYDGEGNTKGIIVQNGESIAVLAKKFGCSEEDIKNANPELVKGKGANAYFIVGQEIKIPKELEADDKALQGRATKEEAVKGYEEFAAKKAAEEAAKKAEAEAAAQAEKDAAEAAKEKEHRAEMQKQGKEVAKDLYDDMDGIGTRKTFGDNIKRINKENVVEVIQGYTEKSPDESLTEAILDEAGMNLNKRKEAVTHIYNQLIARAKEKGIDTTQAEKEFAEAIKLKNGSANNEDFDPIFNTLCAAINGKSLLTKAEKEEVKNTPPEKQQANTTQLLQDTVDGAEESLNKQLAEDGWAADLWEGMKWCVGSDNLDEKVKADIKDYKAQLATLKSAKTPEEFKAKFKEIYGVDYDPELVKAYEKRQEQLPLVEATHGVEENFNKEMKNLLASDKLAPKTQYIQTSSFGTGTYQEVASKEQVYNDELNKFAEFIGQGDKAQGLKDIEQAFKDAGLPENASMDDKYKVLHKLAKNYSEILHANTMEATEGKGYDAFTQEAESAYKAAFGLKNDIAKRVADYNTSQKTGDMIVKGVVKGGAAIGLALIPGVGLAAAAIGTGIISATVDVSDRMSSEVGLKDGELTEILKNASIDGATVFAGGQLTKMLSNAKTFVKIGGQLTGDVAVGAAAEKMQTGNITLNGVLFQCVFSAAGNLVALKNMGKAPKDAPNIEVPKTEPKPQSAAERGGRDAIADAEVARNIDSKHASNKARKHIEEGVKDTPTPAELEAYRKEHGYQEPTPEQRVDIDENNAYAAEANAEAHRVENNTSPESKAALEKARAGMTEPDTNLNGVFKNDNAEFTIKDGKIVEIKTADGRVITDEVKIAKYEAKHGIKTEELSPVKSETPETPKAEEPQPAKVEDTPETPKAEEPKPAQSEETPEAPKAQEPEVYYPTPEERMAMGQIGSNINAAKSLKDIEKAQAWLDKLPDCDQKRVLQNQLNSKLENIKANNAAAPQPEAVKNRPVPETAPDVSLKKGQSAVVASDAKIELGKNGFELDLNSPEIRKRLSKMKDGDSVTIGRAAEESNADIQLKNADDTVSRNHLKITKQGDTFVIEDTSMNGSVVNPTPKVRPHAEAAPPKVSPVEQSNKFADTSRVEVGEKIADGYKDGGRYRHFDENGNVQNPSREVVVVNRQQDKKLQSLIEDVKAKTANMTDKQKAKYLQEYINDLVGKGDAALVKNCDIWDKQHRGQDVLLGDIVTHNPPIAVCRHRSLLYKVLGDEVGLKVELQRGNFYNAEGSGGGHAWNTVRFDDGSSAIFDAMHNRSSSTTPGNVDPYAKQYYTVEDQPLYNNGLKNDVQNQRASRAAGEDPSVNSNRARNNINSIPDSDIPKQHRKLWADCKQRYNEISAAFKEAVSDAGAGLTAKCQTLYADLQKIANSVTGSVKAKINALMKDIREMMDNIKVGANSKREYTLNAKDRKNVNQLREIYHGELSDVNYLRSEYPQYKHLSDAELLKEFKLDENHAAFVRNRKDLFGDGKYNERAYWNDSPFEQMNDHSAWKMHLYSVSEADYQQMAEVILPYLNKNNVAHKTLSSTMSPELLAKTAPEQAGKAFTIYPSSNQEMEKIARDLDRLIKQHNLQTGNSHITGDNQLGDSGRLFYRYEFPTGQLKDKIYKPGEHAPYDANRGEGKYLAADMTVEDDPWHNFNPSDPASKPNNGSSAPRARQFELERGKHYPLNDEVNKINMADYTLDLNNPRIKQMLAKLPEGGQITIGREGNIRIPDKYSTVSRVHVTITKQNGRLYITDHSKNGTSLVA